jgi:hypothetical protein
MGGLYDAFRTDKTLEQKGIDLDYGFCVVTIARAGGSNHKYNRLLEAKSKPYRRAIKTETMDPVIAENIMYEVFAEAIVLNWQTRASDGKLVKGIEPPKKGGDLLPVNTKNIISTFKELPDIYADIQAQAHTMALYRAEVMEEEAKN